MRRVRLGRTNLEVSRWALGGIPLSVAMGGKDEETIHRIINEALDAGVNLIDTSRVYMDSETNIGEVIRSRRNECIIATKTHTRDYDGVMSDLEDSLKELQTDKIDIYQIHEIYPEEKEQVLGKAGALEAFIKAKEQGMIDFIGVTGHHADLLVEMMETGAFDTVMVPFNVIERDPEKELIALSRKMDIGTMIMKPLAGGVFKNIEKCFRFFNSYPVDVILNGVSSLDELHGNMKWAENTEPLSSRELKDFEDEVAHFGKDFCRRCSYCLPCPSDILIPVMINVIWQQVKGSRYEELPAIKKRMGENLMIWWQACEECGRCEEKCPYDIPIIQRKNDLIRLFGNKG